MINLESRDSHLWNLEQSIIDIINEGISGEHTILIETDNEGVCLNSCGFYNTLDRICDKFSINKDRILIHTPNVEEMHNTYKISQKENVHVRLNQKEQIIPVVKNPQLRPIGCFIGKINWARLAILSWLDQYADKCLITCHYEFDNKDDLTSISSLQLNDNFVNFAKDTELAVSFLQTCPRVLGSGFQIPYKSEPITQDVVTNIEVKLSEGYSDIFAEIVCETYFSGLTFFPTGKTWRPIQQLTPFIVQGPTGYLANLRRVGFKTFSDYWDESYDEYAGAERITYIQQIAKKLFTLDTNILSQMYEDMRPILLHNKRKFIDLNPQELLLDEQR